MKFEIDISGEDLLSSDYVVCIANGEIKGFKFKKDYINILNSKFGQNKYRYSKSKKGKTLFKLRLYSIAIYYLIKSLKIKKINLFLCKDFDGNEDNIKSNLNYFIEDLLNMEIESINFGKLSKDSNAHRYSYLMRKDKKNKMSTYINIKLKDIEKFL